MPDQRAADQNHVDWDTASDILTSFHQVTGVPCLAFDSVGRLRLSIGGADSPCALCRVLAGLGQEPQCGQVHRHGAEEAQRFGGRYIYFCPSEMAYFSSPLMMGGQRVGSLVCGPVLIMDPDDYLAGAPFTPKLSEAERERLRADLQGFCRAEPEEIDHYSNLLFALAVYIGGNSLSLLRRREGEQQQRTLGEFISSLKESPDSGDYPVAKEEQLAAAIRGGDSLNARRLLNELLGWVMFSTGGDVEEVRMRSVELLVVISRAAIGGGADPAPVLSLNRTAMGELARCRGMEELTLTLAGLTSRYAGLVLRTVDLRHRKVLNRALDYIGTHYMHPIRAEEVARHVGLSPNYFSAVFKAEMDCTFRRYLNQVRVEKSQVLLLTPELSILQICNMCGFEDQSYFIKVFRKYTGTTPAKFRDQHSRILRERERSGDA